MKSLEKGRQYLFSNRVSFFKILKTAVISFFIIFSVQNIFAEETGSVITIESAQSTQYKKDPDTKDDIIVLVGNVSISVAKDGTVTTITADSVNYNRKTDMLYASGNVTLKQTGSGSAGGQDVTADSLLFNTDTLEGVFDNGRAVQTQSDAINLPSGSTLIVSSKIFGRDSSSTIAFKNATLTFCDDENPHWKIKAARIWLLPGGEFAFLGALLYVGQIPVFPLPGFYYPKDELIFNPVFGYNTKKGFYINTTYYIYGRKPLDSSSSSSSSSENVSEGLFNFMKATKLKEQKREGLVLHNLDEDYNGNTSDYFKILADYYTNLGPLVGFEGVFKPGKIVTNIEVGAQIAFSNTVFSYINGGYSAFSTDGVIYEDKSSFMGLNLPFRYSANLKFSLSKPFNLTLSIPLYSDPFFYYDFSNRKESMDWIGFLMSNAEGSLDDDTASELSSFTWSLNGSYSVSIPKILNPFITSLSLSSFSSQLVFSSKQKIFAEDEDQTWKNNTPERKFYFPSQITPFKASGRIAGTLLQINSKSSVKTSSSAIKFDIPLEPPEILKAPDSADTDSKKAEESETEGEEKENLLPEDAFVYITTADSSVKSVDRLNYSLTYSISPEFTSQLNYDSLNIKTPETFDWSVLQSSYYQVKAPATLSSSLGYRGSFLSLKNSFSFNPVFQEHPNLDGYYEDKQTADGILQILNSSGKALKKTDYEARKLDLSNTNTLSFRPFIYSERFSGTGFDWNTTMKLVRTEFLDEAIDWEKSEDGNPQWRYKMPWDTDEDDEDGWFNDNWFTTNTLTGTISSSKDGYSQTLSLSTKLPPQKDEYSGTLSFGFPNASVSFATSIQQTENTVTSADGTTNEIQKKWELQPFQQTASLKLFTPKTSSSTSSSSSSSTSSSVNNTVTLTESWNYNWSILEEGETAADKWYSSGLKFSLGWRGLSLAYTMQYTYGYDFYSSQEEADKAGKEIGWNIRKEDDGSGTGKLIDKKEFLPVSLTLSYSTPSTTLRLWKNRIVLSPSLSTSLNYDLLRPTNSSFKFTPSLTFKINEFFDLTFSSDSRNSQIFKYMQDWGIFESYGRPYGENVPNPFIDLLNSFGFFYNGKFFAGDEARKASAYKLQNLSIKLTHNACDWDFAASFTVKPRLVNHVYNFDPYITISAIWKPLPSMKSEIVDDYGTWKLNP